ncbi:hypothetical protein [Roseospira goensis]|uniref:Uncharacterized protein n=1 Tax=Roseospira goensis TaxID=391922 RepID=A0A7W6RXR0_9PROT|nr:hypothetical protein [Roseospira goensis]MBB4284529.1 hypothetical protein [Roseospira goensis]
MTHANKIEISMSEYQSLLDIKRKAEAAGFLSDFSNTLARTIEQRLAHFRQPLFPNPTTGRTASSVHGVLKALAC